MVSKQRLNSEHRFELQSELERLPSHFNHKIEKVCSAVLELFLIHYTNFMNYRLLEKHHVF